MLGKRFVTKICVKVLGSNGAPKVSHSVSIHSQSDCCMYFNSIYICAVQGEGEL